MLEVLYTCLVEQHDLRLVALAVLVCALACFTAISLLKHVQRTQGPMRRAWICVAAISSGFGIWATHFIAMLAFAPGLPTAYNVALTMLSLFVAILLTGAGLAAAVNETARGARWIGGAVVGGGIAAMHYTGMAAFEVAGRIVWDPALVGVSIALGALIGSAALPAGLRDFSVRATALGGLLLTLAICSHHFTAMAAAAIIPDPSIDVSQWAVPKSWLAVGVAFASFAILLLTFGAVGLDIRERAHWREAEHMRGLANAAVEGLLVCDGEAIVSANNSFGALSGVQPEAAAGRRLEDFGPDESIRQKLLERPDVPLETLLRQANGTAIPVEIVQRGVDFAGRRHTAVAVRDLSERKKAESDIHFLAHHDALTGLPNRGAFNARLDEEIRTHIGSDRHLAVLLLDLDRFKEVNDLFGHAAGDSLLQRIATCATSILGDDQMLARLGGDEFAVIAPDLDDPAEAGQLAEAILDAVRLPNDGVSASVPISTSIGIAVFPRDAADRAALLKCADTALYRAKTDGRGVHRIFEAAMGLRLRERRLVERDLRQAPAQGELDLAYQPQVRIDTGEVTGFEALLRWNHPAKGEISPAHFVPIAEETGLILEIGEWVLSSACCEAASWLRPLRVAVNVSAVQLHNANFAQLVSEVLSQSGLPPQRLELEITETALIRDLDRALTTLRLLKEIGVRISMDDFGTGYCSLSNLKAFPFDRIKIDRSFIRSVDANAEAAVIVRAVLGLGRGLGLPVLAEGVETQGELAFLRDEFCAEAQGYLLGRPEPIHAYRGITQELRPPEHHRVSTRNGHARAGKRVDVRPAEGWAAGHGDSRAASQAFVSPFS